jgi:hypothetical protein
MVPLPPVMLNKVIYFPQAGSTEVACQLFHVDPGFLSGNLHRDGGVVFYLMALIILGAVLQVLRSAEKRRPPTNSGRVLAPVAVMLAH